MESLAAQVVRLVRGARVGLVLGDGFTERIRYIVDGTTGRLVFPAVPGIAELESLVLCVPDEAPETGPEAQLLLIDEAVEQTCSLAGASRDRWEAWFGRSHPARWVSASIESAKFNGEVADDGPIDCSNPWWRVEGTLCKALNEDRARLEGACARARGRATSGAVAVAIDPSGVDVRCDAALEPIRVEVEAWEGQGPSGAMEAVTRWLA